MVWWKVGKISLTKSLARATRAAEIEINRGDLRRTGLKGIRIRSCILR